MGFVGYKICTTINTTMTATIIDPECLATKFLEQWHNDEPYIVAHTSGSTGVPKAINLLKSDMRLSAQMTNRKFDITRNSTLFLPLSVDYIAGKMVVVRALEAGCTLIIEPASNHPIKQQPKAIDLISVVPSQVDSILSRPQCLAAIRNLLIGGAAIDNELENRVISSGINAYVSYGMTETCSHVALRRVGQSPIYQALPGIKFATDGDDRLAITSRQMSFSRLQTNDIVRLIDDEHFIWLGRYDNVINSGGIKVYPETIERKIAGIINGRYYITSQNDAKWGNVPILVIEGENDLARTERIREMLHESLSPAEMPKAIKYVNQIELTSNGKIKRH
jgi:O-succinylbenzoic acid--CoA ligase